MKCQKCGWNNPAQQNRCQRCGALLPQVHPAGFPAGADDITRPYFADQSNHPDPRLQRQNIPHQNFDRPSFAGQPNGYQSPQPDCIPIQSERMPAWQDPVCEPKKKGKAGIVILCIVGLLLGGAGSFGLVWWIQNSGQAQSADAGAADAKESDVQEDYLAIKTTGLWNEPFGTESRGIVSEGDILPVTKIRAYPQEKAIWALSNQGWAAVELDGSRTLEKLIPAAVKEGGINETLYTQKVMFLYEKPARSSRQIEAMDAGKELHPVELQIDQCESRWGKTAQGGWFLISDPAGTYCATSDPLANAADAPVSNEKPNPSPSSQTEQLPSAEQAPAGAIHFDRHPREGVSYSGPAAVQSLLSIWDISLSQQTLAERMKTTKVTDYRNLQEVLNQELSDHRIPAKYYGVYLSNDELSPAEKDNFFSRLDKDLQDGYPLLVNVNHTALSGKDQNSYALIYAKAEKSGQRLYYLYAPLDSDFETIINADSLLNVMQDCGFFCYLY